MTINEHQTQTLAEVIVKMLTLQQADLPLGLAAIERAVVLWREHHAVVESETKP